MTYRRGIQVWRKDGRLLIIRDFVFLQHKLDIEHADGKHETRINTLRDYGDPKAFSAMARLVDIMRSGCCAGVRGKAACQRGCWRRIGMRFVIF